MSGSRDLFLEFWNPTYISGMIEAGNFKFGTKMEAVSANEKNPKLVKRGHV